VWVKLGLEKSIDVNSITMHEKKSSSSSKEIFIKGSIPEILKISHFNKSLVDNQGWNFSCQVDFLYLSQNYHLW
jgi:hypothetical protein